MIQISDSPPKSIEDHIQSFIQLCENLNTPSQSVHSTTTNYVGRLGPTTPTSPYLNDPNPKALKKQSKKPKSKNQLLWDTTTPQISGKSTAKPNSSMIVTYPNGSQRQFGKSGYGKARKRENTRALYDDHELAALCSSQPHRAFKQFQSTMPDLYDNTAFKYWIPINQLEDIPPTFYMKEEFNQKAGLINVDPSTIETPYDAFRLFFNDNIYDLICDKTNSKILHNLTVETQAYIDGVNPLRPAYNDFRLTHGLLDGYFAAQIYRGLVKIPKQKDYWKDSIHYQTGSTDGMRLPCQEGRKAPVDTFQEEFHGEKLNVGKMNQIINRRLYELIRDNLSITDYTIKNNPDPLIKIREFVEMINQNLQHYYQPGEYLAVDEGMIPFSGKLKFKVFNPDKPTQWGIKEFLLCDARHAYTLQVKIHCPDEDDNPKRLMTKTHQLTLQLLQDYSGKNHKIVMDNYYTSPQLFTELKAQKIGAVGTCRHNRTGLSKQDLDEPHFKKIYPPYKDYANYLSVDNNNVLVYFMGSNEKEIALLSSFIDTSKNYQHNNDIVKNHYRLIPQQQGPFMIYIYNKYKGGCDKRNQFVSHYRYKTSNYKWWRAVFDRMFETAVVNASIVMKQLFPEKANKDAWLKDFRIALMKNLIEKYHQKVSVVSPIQKKNFKKHTLLEGEKILKCIECGVETRLMCQECTMVQDDVIAVCKNNNEQCYRFHLCSGVGLELKKAQDPMFSQEAQEFLNKKMMQRKKKSLITTVSRHELKMIKQQLLESNQEKTTEFNRALSLLNETIGKLNDQNPQMEISQELSDLLACLDTTKRDDEEEQDLAKIYEMQQKLHIQSIRNQQHKQEQKEECSLRGSKKVKMIGKCQMVNY